MFVVTARAIQLLTNGGHFPPFFWPVTFENQSVPPPGGATLKQLSSLGYCVCFEGREQEHQPWVWPETKSA